MKSAQAAILAAAVVLSLSACSMRNEWTDDASHSGEQRREKARQDEGNTPPPSPPPY